MQLHPAGCFGAVVRREAPSWLVSGHLHFDVMIVRLPELCPSPPSAERTLQELSIWPAACESPIQRAWNILWKFLAKLCSGASGPPTPFGELVRSVLGRFSQVSHVERISLGGRTLFLPPAPPASLCRPLGACAKSTSWRLHPSWAMAWSSWGLHAGAGRLPVIRVIRAGALVPEESCLCLHGAFWEVWGSAGSLGGGVA